MNGFEAWVTRLITALPFGRRLAPLQNRLASFGEQGLQGAANFLVNAILARGLTHEGFATIGMMLGVHYFVLGTHRTVIVLPFILDVSHDAAHNNMMDKGAGRWWWFNLVSVLMIALLLGGVALLAALVTAGARDSQWIVHGMALAAIVSPILLLFEFGRRLLYQDRLASTAAAISAVYLVLNLGMAVIARHIGASPAIGALAWVVAGLGAWSLTIWAIPPGRPSWRQGAHIWWQNRNFAFWQGLTNLPYAIYNSSVVILVGLFGGVPAAAAFTAARTLTNPAISMVTAVDSLDKPRAARALVSDGLPGLRRSVGQTRRLLVLLTGGYLGLVILFAPQVLHLAFGSAYASEVNEIRVLAIAFFLICMNQPSETFLIVLRASKLLLVTRIIAAAAAVASLALAQPWGLMGACLALLGTHLINVVDLRIGESIAAKRWTREQAESGDDNSDDEDKGEATTVMSLIGEEAA